MQILTLRVLDGQAKQLKKIAKIQGFSTASEWARDYIRKEAKQYEENDSNDIDLASDNN